MQKTLKGKITSVKQNKTVVVEVVRTMAHPLYKKLLTKSKKFQADAGEATYSVGQEVVIVETRRMSKNKNFKVMEEKK